MKTMSLLLMGCAGLFAVSVATEVRGEDAPLSLDALLGKYAGTMRVQLSGTRPWETDYQTEIVSVDKAAMTLSLVARCPRCEISEWKRNNCQITEAKERILFSCKGDTSKEEYIFKDDTLRASGFGKKNPYSISVTKVKN
jgi:hypothetical protein